MNQLIRKNDYFQTQGQGTTSRTSMVEQSGSNKSTILCGMEKNHFNIGQWFLCLGGQWNV